MAILTGAMTVTRLRVLEPGLHEGWRDLYRDRLNEHAFREPPQGVGREEVEGWCQVHNLLDTEFDDFNMWLYQDWAVFALRVDKKNHWIHVCSAGELTLKFLHSKRGCEAIEAIGVIPRYRGVVIHDCWASYLAYDHCGPWSKACDHSSLAGTREDMEYWRDERGIEPERLVWGVPFYGHCWGSACDDGSLTFAQIVSKFPDQKDDDWIEAENLTLSFNGQSTIKAKVEAAREYGGVMVWELGQDASGDDALFRMIAGE